MVIKKTPKTLVLFLHKEAANLKVNEEIYDTIIQNDFNTALTYLTDNNVDQSNFEIRLRKKIKNA